MPRSNPTHRSETGYQDGLGSGWVGEGGGLIVGMRLERCERVGSVLHSAGGFWHEVSTGLEGEMIGCTQQGEKGLRWGSGEVEVRLDL